MILRLKTTLAVIIGALLFLWISVLNGQPFFFPDTGAYVRGAETAVVRVLGPQFGTWWTDDRAEASERSPSKSGVTNSSQQQHKGVTSLDDGVVLSGRSIYYGALLYFGEASGGGLWLSVLGQAFVVSYLLFIMTVRCLGLALGAFVISTAGVAFFSTAPFFVGFLMPDIFAGVTILSTALLIAFWAKLRKLERFALAIVLAFSLLSHSTHLLICISMFGVYTLAVVLFRRKRLEAANILTITACVTAALLGEIAFNFAILKAIGFPPVRPPFITARMIDLGPGYEYLKAHRGENPFIVSQFFDRLPLPADGFLWNADGVFTPADAGTKRALGNEQFAFGLRVLVFDPVGVIGGVGRAGLQQLVKFGLSEFYNCDCLPGRLPVEYLKKANDTLSRRHDWLFDIFSAVQYVFVVASLVFLSIAAIATRFGQETKGFLALHFGKYRLFPPWFFAAVGLGVVANAFICSGFSAVHDRYQARVIWLIPLLAYVVLVRGGQQPASED